MSDEAQQVPGGSEKGAASLASVAPPPRLPRGTEPEAAALLGLDGPKALRRLLAAAGMRLRRSGLGDPVIRGADLQVLAVWQQPSERPAYAALERALLRACGL